MWLFSSRRLDAYRLLEKSCKAAWGFKDLPKVEKTSEGKPYFPAFPGFRFSLAHSGEWAICGLSRREIGVDVEKIKPRRENLPRRVFGVDMDWEEFYRRWTAMEAYGKLTGRGIGPLVGTGFEMPEEVEVFQFRRTDCWVTVCYAKDREKKKEH